MYNKDNINKERKEEMYGQKVVRKEFTPKPQDAKHPRGNPRTRSACDRAGDYPPKVRGSLISLLVTD